MDNCPDESGGLTKIIDLWQTNLDEFGFQGPASQYNSTCSPLTPMDQVLGKRCSAHGPKAAPAYGGYEDALFAQHVMETLDTQNPSVPYFLFWAPHIVHTPLEVPESFYDRFEHITDDNPLHSRRIYHAMVAFAVSRSARTCARLTHTGGSSTPVEHRTRPLAISPISSSRRACGPIVLLFSQVTTVSSATPLRCRQAF